VGQEIILCLKCPHWGDPYSLLFNGARYSNYDGRDLQIAAILHLVRTLKISGYRYSSTDLYAFMSFTGKNLSLNLECIILICA